jgi:phosphatidylglycerol:prolipoprotein diacylglycerol transferase
MVTVSFPGLGIGEFSFNKVAFSLGGIEVRWYGIIMVTGIILAFLYAYYRSKHEGVSFDDLLDYAIFTVISGIVGARLYYVITSGQKYTFGEIFAIWNGGIAIYGAIIGGATALLCVSLYKKIKWQKVFDMVCPGVMIGQIVGRWGNFFNGEAYGESPAADNLLYFMRMELRHENWSNSYICQPTFLYESIWNLVGFLIINALYKKKRFDGQVFLMYITWYGFGRMLIEGLRTDSLMVGTFRISQVVAFLCFIIGSILLVYLSIAAAFREQPSCLLRLPE